MAFIEWLELHITAFRLGVSSDWLRDARERAEAFLARQPEPRTLEDKQRDERTVYAGFATVDELALLDRIHAIEREACR